MSEQDCGQVRDLIPDLAAGRVTSADAGALTTHLGGCAECRAELELVRVLRAGRPDVPAGLAHRVVTTVRRDRRASGPRPWWGLTAAAVAALALGIGVSTRPSGAPVDVPGYAYETDEGVVWSSDDGLLAGAPMIDELTDEALEQLLVELSVGSSGGAA
jgi:anti-sigma factor RsiW